MKFPNYLINSLATIGVISLIIMACSADSDNSTIDNSTIDNNTGSANSIGKYQITDSGNHFFVMETETGIVKQYHRSNVIGGYDFFFSKNYKYSTLRKNIFYYWISFEIMNSVY